MALAGIRVVEMVGLAPAPFCGMILADFGAQVTRIDRVPAGLQLDRLTRGKRSLAVNLKSEQGVEVVKKLCKRSDVLIEPFRPGVMEKLGLSPQILFQDNPGLIYARLTGYGQDGPYKNLAGHDINYLAISGILSTLGRVNEKPFPPINLLADFAGGGLMCAFHILLAILERQKTGKGKVIDASMVEGAAYVGSWLFHSRDLEFAWGKERGRNLLDGGSPVYDTYETADGKFVAVGALEPQFFGELFDKLSLDIDTSMLFDEPETVRDLLSSKFRTKTRSEWESYFQDSDACVTPVLELTEVGENEHNKSRRSFIHNPDRPSCPWEPTPGNGTKSQSSKPDHQDHRTKPSIPGSESVSNETGRNILGELGYSVNEIEGLVRHKIVEFDEQSSKL